jgi:DUF1680 family protein
MSPTRPDYPFKPVPFTRVQLTDEFWAPRIETNRATTIPVAFQQCERTNRIYHFERAAKALRGEPLEDTTAPGYPFDDTDVYKVIEGASYTLGVHPDPRLDAYVDGLIAKIAAAQEPDGYIYTTRTINPKAPHRWAGPDRWVLVRDDSHELYNLGHLIEAAVAHHLATGKRSLLDVATSAADLLVKSSTKLFSTTSNPPLIPRNFVSNSISRDDAMCSSSKPIARSVSHLSGCAVPNTSAPRCLAI